MTHRVLLLGSGKIGRMIARMLVDSGDYQVVLADADASLLERLGALLQVESRRVDARDRQQLLAAMQEADLVVSALSFHHNQQVAEAAVEAGIDYFDLTEDLQTTRAVRQIAARARPGQIFMPQCGLAPGFISVVAYSMTRAFDRLDSVHMRVGALPQFPTGALKYNLTWSTDGLINEYCNPCEVIYQGARREVLPLEGSEQFSLDGVRYEAFNTSGGLGSLCETLDGKVRDLNYKTIRYPGHRDLVAFLISELRLGERREMLQSILEGAVPITFQDVVIVFCTVVGWRNGQLVKVSDARKIYSREIAGEHWSAIQITTASGVCTMVDLRCQGALQAQGYVRQEEVDLETFLENRFGRYYRSLAGTRFSQSVPSAPEEEETGL